MGRLNCGIFAEDKYFHKTCEGVAFVNTLNHLCKENSEGHKFHLSVDASTTCTGFYIARDDFELHMMFDYAREFSDKERYFLDLEYILNHLVWGLDIDLLLIEQPILQSRNRHTKDVLLSLCRRLKRCMQNIPELIGKKPIDVRPNSWKSWVFDKEKHKGGYNSKAVLAQCLCEKYPVYWAHFGKSTSKDFDCFDATSIMRHYIDQMQNAQGEAVNFASAEYTHKSFVWARFIGEGEEKPDVTFTYAANPKPVKVKLWNKDYNFYKNIKMASCGKDVVVMKIEDDFTKVLVCLEASIDIVPNADLYVRVMRESFCTDRLCFSVEGLGYRGFTVY